MELSKARIASKVVRYTMFVRASRRFLWIILLILLIMVIAFPLINKDKTGLRMAFSAEDVDISDLPVMKNPRFQGVNEDNKPFLVTADYAVQKSTEEIILHKLKADMLQNEGDWALVEAGSGRLFLDKREMFLEDKVMFFHEAGHELRTKEMYIDMAKGYAKSDVEITGQTFAGNIRADSFSAHERGQRVKFEGNIKMNIYPARIKDNK